jgi:hypothetical protein
VITPFLSDFHTLLQLLCLTQPQAGEDLHQELECCQQKAGDFEWVLHIAESPVLRRAVRDLPPNAAQYLLLMVQNVRKSRSNIATWGGYIDPLLSRAVTGVDINISWKCHAH